MPDEPLVRGGDTPPKSAAGRQLMVRLIMVLVVAAIAAAGAWWYFSGRQTAPEWDRAADLSLAAPAGDAFRAETPWVTLKLAPTRAGQPNTLRVGFDWPEGTPEAASAPRPNIVAVTTAPVGDASAPQALALSPDSTGTDALSGSVTFTKGGWWRLSVEVDGAQQAASFYVLIPDPNVNGPGAVAGNATTADGEALYKRGLTGITSLNSVRYTQWQADGKGNAGISEHAVTAGGPDEPPGFSYRALGGMEAVVIGTTRWVKLPNEFGWTEQEGAISVPPSQWGEEYAGATQFTVLGEETIDGMQTQILSFLVPEVTEPRRQSAAWYLWWVDTESGRVRREAMVSRIHYMRNTFSDFDVPVALAPPISESAPAAGTPQP